MEHKDRIVNDVERMAKMGRSVVQAAGKAKAAAKVAYHDPVRVPTFNMSADLENSMVAGIGHSFGPWLPEPLGWDADLEPGSERVANMAVINVDECALNHAFANFSKHYLGAAFWFRFGTFHRRSNDMMRAMALSRLIGSAQKAIVWLSCTHGAWVQAPFLRAFRETAADIPKIYGPNSRPVMLFWPWVCADRSWTNPEDVNEAARQKWLNSIPGAQAACSKNRTASLKKWMSVTLGLNEADKALHTILFVWVTYCVQHQRPLNWDQNAHASHVGLYRGRAARRCSACPSLWLI